MTGPLDLSGKAVLVTGGSRGVGRAIAALFARAGADVAIGYRSREAEARSTVEEVRSARVRGTSIAADLSTREGAEGLVRGALEELGRLDFLIGNHGVWPPDDVPLAEMPEERWRRTLATNLDGLFLVLRAAIPHLGEGGGVVLVSSTAAQRGEAFHADYAASKGALHSLAKGLCVELAPRGIRVNVVAPGWIDTEMAAPALVDGGRDRIARAIPLGRVASPDDVAGPVLFLCSSLARHVTGEILNVNGGAVLPG